MQPNNEEEKGAHENCQTLIKKQAKTKKIIKKSNKKEKTEIVPPSNFRPGFIYSFLASVCVCVRR
jgi:hypothetical protein